MKSFHKKAPLMYAVLAGFFVLLSILWVPESVIAQDFRLPLLYEEDFQVPPSGWDLDEGWQFKEGEILRGELPFSPDGIVRSASLKRPFDHNLPGRYRVSFTLEHLEGYFDAVLFQNDGGDDYGLRFSYNFKEGIDYEPIWTRTVSFMNFSDDFQPLNTVEFDLIRDDKYLVTVTHAAELIVEIINLSSPQEPLVFSQTVGDLYPRQIKFRLISGIDSPDKRALVRIDDLRIWGDRLAFIGWVSGSDLNDSSSIYPIPGTKMTLLGSNDPGDPRGRLLARAVTDEKGTFNLFTTDRFFFYSVIAEVPEGYQFFKADPTLGRLVRDNWVEYENPFFKFPEQDNFESSFQYAQIPTPTPRRRPTSTPTPRSTATQESVIPDTKRPSPTPTMTERSDGVIAPDRRTQPPEPPQNPNISVFLIPVLIGAGLIGGYFLVRRLRKSPGSDQPPPEEPRKIPPVPPLLPPIRLLNFWLADDLSGKGTLSDDQPLSQGYIYTLHLQIQPHILQSGEENIATPDGDLRLRSVLFVSPSDFQIDDTVTEFVLPAKGASPTLQIPFRPMRTGILQMRIGIYSGNHLVQSGTITMQVEPSQAVRKTPGAIHRWLDYVSSSRFYDLHILSQPDLQIFVNRGPANTHWIGAFAADQPLHSSLRSGVMQSLSETRLSAYADQMRDLLQDIQDNGGYAEPPVLLTENDIYHHATDLVDLARKGYSLFLSLFSFHQDKIEDQRIRDLREALYEPGLVTIASCYEDTPTFPWATIYDLHLDLGLEIKLCAIYQKYLGDNPGINSIDLTENPTDLLDSPGRCRANPACPLKGPDSQTTVCPFGFWGFRHRIEQPIQMVTPTRPGKVPKELIGSKYEKGIFINHQLSQSLRLLMGVYQGFSKISNHREEIQELDPELEVEYLWERDKILRVMENGNPQLIYFFCHGEIFDNQFRIVVGESENEGKIYSANLVNVNWHPPLRPMVILNGCRTIIDRPELVGSFLKSLRGIGAVGVVGCEIEVVTDLAFSFGRLFLKGLLEGRSAGELFLYFRRNLERQGYPLGMVFELFAPADLHLHVPGDGNCQWCKENQRVRSTQIIQ